MHLLCCRTSAAGGHGTVEVAPPRRPGTRGVVVCGGFAGTDRACSWPLKSIHPIAISCKQIMCLSYVVYTWQGDRIWLLHCYKLYTLICAFTSNQHKVWDTSLEQKGSTGFIHECTGFIQQMLHECASLAAAPLNTLAYGCIKLGADLHWWSWRPSRESWLPAQSRARAWPLQSIHPVVIPITCSRRRKCFSHEGSFGYLLSKWVERDASRRHGCVLIYRQGTAPCVAFTSLGKKLTCVQMILTNPIHLHPFFLIQQEATTTTRSPTT
jgi:hypothetical protein